jgi:hypothetical protein
LRGKKEKQCLSLISLDTEHREVGIPFFKDDAFQSGVSEKSDDSLVLLVWMGMSDALWPRICI